MDNHLSQIENKYGQIRGKMSLLTPKDWSLAQSWIDKDIPINIILRAMGEVGKKFNAENRPGKINSLSYFTQEVEKQFANWSKNQVGKGKDIESNVNQPDEAVMNSILGLIEDLKQSIPGLPERVKPFARQMVESVDKLHGKVRENSLSMNDIERELLEISINFDMAIQSVLPVKTSIRLNAEINQELKGLPISKSHRQFKLRDKLFDLWNLPKLSLLDD